MRKPYIAIPNFDLIRVSGKDAATFLQGQLTCNVVKLTSEQWIPGAYCEINGKVIADFRLFDHEQGYYLLCQQGVGTALKEALSKYAVFSKASIEVLSDDYYRLGFYGEHSVRQWLKENIGSTGFPDLKLRFTSVENCLILNLLGSESRFEVLVPRERMPNPDKMLELATDANKADWRLADIRDGHVHIEQDMMNQYTPQVLNYDLIGAVDFKKGCYRGQEIVARMHYKGSAKKRLFRIELEGSMPSLGDTVSVAGKDLGSIISVAPSGENASEALAVLSSIVLDCPVDQLAMTHGADSSPIAAKVLGVKSPHSH
jgi:folate-binding protein YgfZ